MGALGNIEALFKLDSGVTQLVQFLEQHLRINDHAAAHEAASVWIKNPRWHEMNFERAKLVDDSMPRVVAAIVARDQVGAPRKIINCLALALVTPLRTNNHGN